VLHCNKLWRQLQKLAYVYFLSAAFLLTLVHEKTYGLVGLILFFLIYQLWIYKKLLLPEYNTQSEARRSQAS
jgi:DMSO/TMAO reductase YedYZ heme-binding membrane subunit